MGSVDRAGTRIERSSPTLNLETIILRDVDLSPSPMALHVASAGVLAWKNHNGSSESITVSAGQVLTFQPLQILSATTATVLGYVD